MIDEVADQLLWVGQKKKNSTKTEGVKHTAFYEAFFGKSY